MPCARVTFALFFGLYPDQIQLWDETLQGYVAVMVRWESAGPKVEMVTASFALASCILYKNEQAL